jgi:hypothetical protein
MAFNLNTFKTTLTEPLALNKYEVTITPPGGGTRFELITESVTVPSVSFFSVDNHRPYGYGPIYTIPYGSNFTDVTCVHIIDRKSLVHKEFFKWATGIVNWKQKHQVQYLEKYASSDMTIKTYDNQGNLSATYKLREAFPVNIDQLSLSWLSNDDYAKLTVTYKFTDWDMI